MALLAVFALGLPTPPDSPRQGYLKFEPAIGERKVPGRPRRTPTNGSITQKETDAGQAGTPIDRLQTQPSQRGLLPAMPQRKTAPRGLPPVRVLSRKAGGGPPDLGRLSSGKLWRVIPIGPRHFERNSRRSQVVRDGVAFNLREPGKGRLAYLALIDISGQTQDFLPLHALRVMS